MEMPALGDAALGTGAAGPLIDDDAR